MRGKRLVSVGFVEPSKLPVNGRIAVEWKLADSDGALARVGGRKADDFGIYTLPGELAEDASRSRSGRIPHLSRPHAGKYVLTLTPVVKEAPVGDGALARKGEAPEMFPVPTSTPWPKGAAANARERQAHQPRDGFEQARLGTVIEAEPNDTPEQRRFCRWLRLRTRCRP